MLLTASGPTRGCDVRIAIDYTPAIRQAAGIGRLTRHLVRELVQLDDSHTYCLFIAGAIPPESAGAANWPAHVDLRSTRISERLLMILWHRMRIPWPVERFVGACDVFHSTDFVLPPVSGARTLLTVHDLTFLRYPQCAHPKLRAYLSEVVPRSLARADRVLADSFATKEDLTDLLGVDPDRISVVYGGIEARFSPTADPQDSAIREQYGLDRPYMLSLGTIEPRKNYERLISAYDQLLAEAGGNLPQLAIAGGKGWLYDNVFAVVDRPHLHDRVRFLGFVDDAHLPALYRGAQLFVFPSLYEGFGFPPLEAMACGCPVVCSNSSSLPEVAGDAAIPVDPTDVEALASAIDTGLSDTDLRARLVRRGLSRAARFNWPASARKLLNEYERVSQI